MQKEVLKIVLNKKVFFEIEIKAVSIDVNDEKFNSFTSKLSESISDLLIENYTNGMEVLH